MTHWNTLGAAALLAAITTPATAQTSPPLELTGYVVLEKVTTDERGAHTVVRLEPGTVVPGDKLIFGTRYTNKGSTAIDRFIVSNPVPDTVSVTSDIDPDVLVSVNGGKSWARLIELEIVNAAGERRAARPGDITHVRWELPEIVPGETGQLEFPVTVR